MARRVSKLEDELFGDGQLSRHVYELSPEVIKFQRAVHPLSGMLEWLRRGSEKYRFDEELQRSLRDVLDHTIRVNERVDSFRAILENALTVHSAIVARRQTESGLAQNDEIKRSPRGRRSSSRQRSWARSTA